MRWTLLAAGAAIAATLWLPGEAAQPDSRGTPAPVAASAAPAVAPSGTAEAITFEQYRDWRVNFIDRRRNELAVELSAGDVAASRKARLEQAKAYYDWFAGLPEPDRDRRFRERFDRIDANHDGRIDAAERGAWHDNQRAFYRRDRAARPAAAEGPTQ